ncbi:MAG: diguanylate cyclase (GGDEF)-like protein [Alteromonadaceae bacterium]|jgi:diguanylate cyclase (GGDEF)-like protein
MKPNYSASIIEQEYLTIVSEFSVDLLAMDSIDDILWPVAQNVIPKLGFVDVVIYLYDDKKQVLVQKAAFGHKNPKAKKIFKPIEIKLGQGIVGHVAINKKPMIIPDTRLIPYYIVDDKFRLSELCVPMMADGMFIGAIDSEHPNENFYNENHLKVIVTIASLLATKILQLRSIDSLNQVVAELEYNKKIQSSLFEIAELIFKSTNIDDFYRQLHDCISRLMFSNNFYIGLLAKNKKSFTLAYCVDEFDTDLDKEQIPINKEKPSITGFVFTSNEALLIYEEELKQRIADGQLYVRGSLPKAWLGVPFGDGDSRGIVVVQSYLGGYLFTEKDKQLLTFVAKHIYNALERMKAKTELQFLALHDPLTKLPNRLLFTDRVQHAIAYARRNKKYSLALFFLDLDKFKEINDNYGHHIGDLLLIQVATTINSCLRESDTLCRLGGDEFAVLLNDITLQHEIELIAEKVADAVRQTIDIGELQFDISMSIGVTSFSSGKEVAEQLLIQADRAMYKAKEMGRNKIIYYRKLQ